MLVAYFVYSVALYVYPAIWAYFTQARFGWGTQMVGVSLAVYGLSSAAVQIWLIRIMLRRFGERRTVIYGMVFEIAAVLALAIVGNGMVALILTPLAALGAVITPALQGIMSARVSDDAQGELQGVLTSVYALAVIVSPLMMTSVFAAFTAPGAAVYVPGAPFVVAALLLAGALAILWRMPDTAERAVS